MQYLRKLTLLPLLAIFACTSQITDNKVNPDIIPAAEGFNFEGSDSIAMDIADSVVLAMGGKRNLDSIRYINFNFFGARSHFWDRKENLLRIESKRTDMRIITDLDSDSGRVFIYGMEQIHPDSVEKFMEVAKAMWINDTYWLLFPFKLKDTGVTLKYKGMEKNEAGILSHVLKLTFEEVGDTPENMYLAYVDPKSYMLTQWDFYRNASDSVPAIISPFEEYGNFKGVKISTKRGKYSFPELAVFHSIPDSLHYSLFNNL